MQETWVQSLGQEDPLEKGMVILSSILSWKIPWTEGSGRLQSMGCQESWTQLSSETITSTVNVSYSIYYSYHLILFKS